MAVSNTLKRTFRDWPPLAGGGGGGALQAGEPGGVAGIILDYSFPLGQTGAYTPDEAEAQILDTDIVWAAPGGATTIDTNGYVTYAGIYRYFQATGSIPVKTTAYRVFELTFMSSSTPLIGEQAAIRFNFDGSANYWAFIADWTGAGYGVRIGEVNPTYVQRASATAGITGNPPVVHMMGIDAGDSLYLSIGTFDEDANESRTMKEVVYNIASRPLKAELNFGFGIFNAVGNIKFRRFAAWDLG